MSKWYVSVLGQSNVEWMKIIDADHVSGMDILHDTLEGFGLHSDVYTRNYARGATAVDGDNYSAPHLPHEEWWQPDSGQHGSALTSALNSMRNDLQSYGIDTATGDKISVVWSQGETDADLISFGLSTVARYKQATLDVFNTLRAEFGTGVEFFLAKTGELNWDASDTPPAPDVIARDHASRDLIQQAQEELAAEHDFIHIVADLGDYSAQMVDKYHYTHDAYEGLAADLAYGMLKHFAPDSDVDSYAAHLAQNLNITGTDQNDMLWGSDVDDRLKGLGGDDLLFGRAGHDLLVGYDGNDELYASSGDDTAYGGNGHDTLHGDEGRDRLYGENGDDNMFGGGGNDQMFGGHGHDLISGGDGNDIVFASHGDDRVYGDAGHDQLNGNDGNDIIAGGGGHDRIHGHNGNDVILGDDGRDTLYGEDGQDTLFGGVDDDDMYGGNDDDFLSGGFGDDTLYGGSGNDTLQGYDGRDVLYGESGDDTLFGNNGDDQLLGGHGNDMLSGGGGNDIIFASDGQDELYGDSGHDQLHGNDGDDMIAGGDGNDFLYGGFGNDVIFGNAGNDTLHAGGGHDMLFGGDGRDTFVFNSDDTYQLDIAEILDFEHGLDRLDISSLVDDLSMAGDDSSVNQLSVNYNFDTHRTTLVIDSVGFEVDLVGNYSGLNTGDFIV